ncbi:MAG: hypothetical protein DWI22_02475 [Planctomycetota bacterium]|nr:MAG: hypothetical protein DWI22_02475 [Planctomycetota bacterium]
MSRISDLDSGSYRYDDAYGLDPPAKFSANRRILRNYVHFLILSASYCHRFTSDNVTPQTLTDLPTSQWTERYVTDEMSARQFNFLSQVTSDHVLSRVSSEAIVSILPVIRTMP